MIIIFVMHLIILPRFGKLGCVHIVVKPGITRVSLPRLIVLCQGMIQLIHTVVYSEPYPDQKVV